MQALAADGEFKKEIKHPPPRQGLIFFTSILSHMSRNEAKQLVKDRGVNR